MPGALQAICEAFGGRITYAKELMHGRECNMTITCPGGLFAGLSSPMTVARYHSLAATDLPDCLKVTATACRTAKLWRCSIKNMKFTVCNSTRSR